MKKSCFNFIMHLLNILLCGRQRQALNGYFSVSNGNNLKFLTAKEKLTPFNGAS